MMAVTTAADIRLVLIVLFIFCAQGGAYLFKNLFVVITI